MAAIILFTFFVLSTFGLTLPLAAQAQQASAHINELRSATQLILDQIPIINGPNCWNSVLYAHGFVSHIRFSSADELVFWLTSPSCRKLEPHEKPAIGDIIALRAQDTELHAMLYLNESEVFSKNTSHRQDPYQTIQADLVYSMFRVDQAICRTLVHPRTCVRWADTYRCDSIRLAREKYALENPDYQHIKNKVEKLNQLVSQLALPNSPFSTEGMQKSLKILSEQLPPIDQNLLQVMQTKKHFFWQALRAEIDSLKKQEEILHKQLTPRGPP